MFYFRENKPITIITALSVLFLIMHTFSAIFNNEREVFMEQDDSLVALIQNYVDYGDEINFDEMIDFDWDTLFVIRSHEVPAFAFERANVEWKNIRTSIGVMDAETLIIFLEDYEIVSYVNYPRIYGDFQNSGTFERNLSKFEVERDEEHNRIYLNHIAVT